MKTLQNVQLLGCVLIVSVLHSPAHASPTSYDFEKCENRSVSFLKDCFKRGGSNNYKSCWVKSKNFHSECYSNIFKQYSKDNARRAAKRKAEKERRLNELNSKNKNREKSESAH